MTKIEPVLADGARPRMACRLVVRPSLRASTERALARAGTHDAVPQASVIELSGRLAHRAWSWLGARLGAALGRSLQARGALVAHHGASEIAHHGASEIAHHGSSATAHNRAPSRRWWASVGTAAWLPLEQPELKAAQLVLAKALGGPLLRRMPLLLGLTVHACLAFCHEAASLVPAHQSPRRGPPPSSLHL